MRSLSRPDYPIPTLVESGVGGEKRNAHRAAYSAEGTVPDKFEDHWNKPDVRGLLHAMQGHVCAYCGLEERTLDVEHFRPKGAVYGEDDTPGYWWLAYEASNYFFGCPACNQKRKSKKFPLLANATRITYETRERLPQEERVLLDPVKDAPVEKWFHLEWNDPTCKLLPAPGLDASDESRIEDVIDFFNLNMDAVVRRRRSAAYEKAVRTAELGNWKEVRRLAMRHYEHSFIARFVLLELRQVLPTPEEEAEDLAGHLWDDMREQVAEILNLRQRGKAPARQDLRQLESYGWALVVLQNQVQGDVVGELLARRLGAEQDPGVREEILKLFRKLCVGVQ